ncbi:MAG: TIGR04086 family membrane protein [Bacillota bacterium]|nr:TIGR04086 family membrane protein [Bacillota bacterium]
MRQEKTETRVTFAGTLRSILTSLVIALAVLIILTGVQSAIFYSITASDIAKTVTGYILLALVAVLSGYMCAASIGKKGILAGALSGLILFAALYVWGLTLGDIKGGLAGNLLHMAICVLAGMFGGIFGVNSKR